MQRFRWLTGGGVLVLAVAYLVVTLDSAGVGAALRSLGRSLTGHPAAWLAAVAAYAAAFGLRTVAWRRVLPALPWAQAWAAIHVSLLGNHVLPLRLGEALRVTSVVRRTASSRLGGADVTASVVLLRVGDLLAVVALAAVGTPALLVGLAGGLAWALAALLLVLALSAYIWVRRRAAAGALVPPGSVVVLLTLAAWAAEATVLWTAAHATGLDLSFGGAVGVTAVTIVAQAVAVTPGGFGTYEAVATAALVAVGLPAGPAFAVALSTHVVKTAYSLVVGSVALVRPRPAYFGPFRLPRRSPTLAPGSAVSDPTRPVVVVVPAHDEEASLPGVLERMPHSVLGYEVQVLVVDDGSSDATAALAESGHARVVAHDRNRGLGAALRTGLAAAVSTDPACVAYLDADGEYPPEQLERLVGPVVTGRADYVVGSRFAGQIDHMHAHRRLGNRVLTVWVRWMTRRPELTDGQSGYRAFSVRAATEAQIIHDYNYAQVLTLDLLGKGYGYAEVPITYQFRESGRSFVRLGRYLRAVVPAVVRQLRVSGRVGEPPPLGRRLAAADTG